MNKAAILLVVLGAVALLAVILLTPVPPPQGGETPQAVCVAMGSALAEKRHDDLLPLVAPRHRGQILVALHAISHIMALQDKWKAKGLDAVLRDLGATNELPRNAVSEQMLRDPAQADAGARQLCGDADWSKVAGAIYGTLVAHGMDFDDELIAPLRAVNAGTDLTIDGDRATGEVAGWPVAFAKVDGRWYFVPVLP